MKMLPILQLMLVFGVYVTNFNDFLSNPLSLFSQAMVLNHFLKAIIHYRLVGRHKLHSMAPSQIALSRVWGTVHVGEELLWE